MTLPFWKTKSLSAMSESEWESLCDGCGKCCLHKLQDEDSERIYLTRVACRLLDVDSCRCTQYEARQSIVPACVRVRPETIATLVLPSSCAYRVLAEGGELASWHPLVSGNPANVHAAGRSVRSWAVSERDLGEDELEDYVVAEEQASPRDCTARGREQLRCGHGRTK